MSFCLDTKGPKDQDEKADDKDPYSCKPRVSGMGKQKHHLKKYPPNPRKGNKKIPEQVRDDGIHNYDLPQAKSLQIHV